MHFPPLPRIVFKSLILGIPLVTLLVGPIYPLFALTRYDEITERTLSAIVLTQAFFTGMFATCLQLLTQTARNQVFTASVL